MNSASPSLKLAAQHELANRHANELDDLARKMADLAERMQCAPLNAEMSRHAAELAGASQVAAGWAKRIRAEVDYQCSKL